jgi:hypothetical protein
MRPPSSPTQLDVEEVAEVPTADVERTNQRETEIETGTGTTVTMVTTTTTVAIVPVISRVTRLT